MSKSSNRLRSSILSAAIVKTGAKKITNIPKGTSPKEFIAQGFQIEINGLKIPRDFKKKNKMRNMPCPCGSKGKFKACCWNLLP